MGKYFGTDGIRGVVNEDLNTELAFLCGNALTSLAKRPKVLICTDTRTSKDMLKAAVIAGLTSGGADVLDLGVLPTPGAAFAARVYNVDFGIVISASHNPPEYNGIKVFDSEGSKISEELIEKIEDFIINKKKFSAKHDEVGKVTDMREDINTRYIDFLVQSAGCKLDGYKVALDCSNGAAYRIAPEVFKRLGAEVAIFYDSDDGAIINRDCGALHPKNIAKLTVEHGADVGFAYDGDSDRVIAADAKGNVVNGDSIIYIMASYLKARGELKGDLAVGTLHTNMGMENALKSKGITLLRTDIGDHFVAARMKATGAVIGGEQSGHIINGRYLPTGDGILASVQLMKVLKSTQKSLNELNDFTNYPQVNINIIVRDKAAVMGNAQLKEAVKHYEEQLKGLGRILVRPSGTEPMVRIMVECEDAEAARSIGEKLKELITKIS